MNEISIPLLLPWLLLVFIKVYEMTFYNVIYNLRFGVGISQTFILMVQDKDEGIESALAYLSEQRNVSTKLFQMLYNKCTNKNLRIVFSLIYKWPVMIVITAILLYYFSWLQFKWISLILSAICVTLIVIEVAHEVIARLALGNVDNFRRYVHLDPTELNNFDRVFYDINKILRDFTITILIQLTCFTWAFSSIYYCLSRFDSKAFSQALDNPIDAVYFAMVVVGTIGFGDIVPVKSFGKVILIFNVTTVMIFVVFIVGHFFATLSDTPKNIIKPRR